MRRIHRGPVNYPHKGTITRKTFPFDDVIMVTAAPGGSCGWGCILLVLDLLDVSSYVLIFTILRRITRWALKNGKKIPCSKTLRIFEQAKRYLNWILFRCQYNTEVRAIGKHTRELLLRDFYVSISSEVKWLHKLFHINVCSGCACPG